MDLNVDELELQIRQRTRNYVKEWGCAPRYLILGYNIYHKFRKYLIDKYAISFITPDGNPNLKSSVIFYNDMALVFVEKEDVLDVAG